MTDVSALDARHVWHPFTQSAEAAPPIEAVGGRGSWIHAADGKRYLDLMSSWWVNLHGHAHPAIAEAIALQAGRLEQVIFADFTHEPAVRLAARVALHLPGDLDRVFYSDDGSTAVEVALKIAHQYWRNRGEERRTYIAFAGGYHGDTVGAMSAGRSSGFFRAWEDLLLPFETVPFPATWDGDTEVEAREAVSLAALEQALTRHAGQVAAIIIEPLVQGAGGMRMCRPEFLRKLQAIAETAGTLVIYDEVMTGFGRTGAIFACVKAGTRPDIVCLSKGLTGGFLALAMTVCRESIHQAFVGGGIERAFLHGHSYTANPLGCAAGLASLDLLESKATQDAILAIEAIHRRRLGDLKDVRHPRITGTIAAFEVGKQDEGYAGAAGRMLKAAFLARGLLIRPLGNVLYMLPPYCITQDELEHAWDQVAEVLNEAAP